MIILKTPLPYSEFKGIQKISQYGVVTSLDETAYTKIFQMIVNDNPDQFKNRPVKPQSFEELEHKADGLSDDELKNIAKARLRIKGIQRKFL